MMHWLSPRGNIIFAAFFPPCTDVAVSGARWFRDKGLGEGAFGRVGEPDVAYGYPELPDGALEELEEFVKSFVRKHFTPSFFAIDNVKPYIITAEDIAEFKD